MDQGVSILLHQKNSFLDCASGVHPAQLTLGSISCTPPSLSSAQFSRSVLSDSLRSHGPQPIRPPCPSPAPRACSNSCPLSQWCHPTISSSVVPFSCLQSWALFPQSSGNHVYSCTELLLPPLEIFFLWGFSWVENLTCALWVSCCPISRFWKTWNILKTYLKTYSKDLSLSRWIAFSIVSKLSMRHLMLFANWIHLFPNWIF